MIVIEIHDPNEQKLQQIAGILLEKQLAIDVEFHRNIERASLENGKLEVKKITMLKAKTLALLFSTIDKTLQEAFPESTPDICSVPIVNMDWKHTKYLRRKLASDDES